MPELWTTERILALAPDASSAKSGKELAAARKWVTLGKDEHALWGECQGSAKTPYQTQIDLSEPAFKCSCPSRKFPCKHGLGLFLLMTAQPGAFSGSTRPAWVAQWLESRASRADQRAKKQEDGAAPPDPAAQARRLAERQKKVAAGVAELDLWLRDLVRQGLASAQGRPLSFWDSAAARMVDAQAPGLARLVREAGGLCASGDQWQARVTDRLGRLSLLIQAFGRIDSLPDATAHDVRSLVGFTVNQDELLLQPGLADDWHVLGQRVTLEDKLRVQRTWLHGPRSQRFALVLQFAYGSQGFDKSLLPGTRVEAELVFFPGASLRAAPKPGHGAPDAIKTWPGFPGINAAGAAYAGHLSQYPWAEQFPFALSAVIPFRSGNAWMIRDTAGAQLALSPRFAQAWNLLALSGGHPIDLFGEWDGEALLPLSAYAAEDFTIFASA